jgi:serpin B
MYRLTALALAAAAVAALPASAVKPAEKGIDGPKGPPSIVQGNNDFAFDLYAQLAKKDGNLFFSPYSISAALAMTSAGARNQTLAEMEKALHFPAQERLHPLFAALHKEVNGQNQGKRAYELRTANKLWGQKGLAFKADFLKLTADSYGAGLEEVDFAGATEAARLKINAWAEKETNDKIKDLLKPGLLTTDTRLVLTNAIYFKGDWQYQFKKDQTREGAFHLAGGKTVKAPLMHQKGAFKFAFLPDLSALELPYSGKDLSMVVLLPHKPDGLADLEKKLNAELFHAALRRLMPEPRLEVTLPKFQTTSEFSLKQALEALGMKQAFSKGADLSGLTGAPDLFISDVVHKAFVDVNEQGTEAAAATGVVVDAKSAPPAFVADHPFVFLIRDNRNGSVLFLGRLVDPTK